MKTLLAGSSLLILLAFASCNGGTAEVQKKAAVDTANFTTVQWLDTLVSIGTINMGEKAQVKFLCKNTGTKPLIITSAKPGCGCTVADYTKEPIAPGGEGWVTGAFDSNKIHGGGDIHKTIIVSTNTSNGTEKYLVFTGNVKGAPGDKVVLPTKPVK
ncbi:DUF1573 domain-containing protein [Parasediminibacterium sp. JCM 36343]|uniref:DUF1573 domain-containing protein n=1 Tax=Parasediminibacterium sp. JCM 36343 TaxID=3374279 RepID=UPI00397867CC